MLPPSSPVHAGSPVGLVSGVEPRACQGIQGGYAALTGREACASLGEVAENLGQDALGVLPGRESGALPVTTSLAPPDAQRTVASLPDTSATPLPSLTPCHAVPP